MGRGPGTQRGGRLGDCGLKVGWAVHRTVKVRSRAIRHWGGGGDSGRHEGHGGLGKTGHRWGVPNHMTFQPGLST